MNRGAIVLLGHGALSQKAMILLVSAATTESLRTLFRGVVGCLVYCYNGLPLVSWLQFFVRAETM